MHYQIIKKQRIDYTVNNVDQLTWTGKTGASWAGLKIDRSRVLDIEQYQIHPVPMTGDGLADRAFILPVLKDVNGELQVTTLVSRSGWKHWYVYDGADWEDDNDRSPLPLAAPENDVAFKPMHAQTQWVRYILDRL